MNDKLKRYGLIFIRLLLALAFIGAGGAKLAGVEMMVATYETIGVGQWFRYLTGIIEVGSAILLFVPGKQAWGAALLVCTMIGAVIAHLFILGPGSTPAIVLGLLSLVVVYTYRRQLPVINRWNR
ncbi:DoxX family protein [Saccharospirillum impatiens]|uniref:DoxX family protein n=1 Tax=Saccharospirillum impatiens TaxID=169438 RepID=UPI000428BBD0|nr:DoxX family protein [Saccharospirillum impatiens]